MEEVTVTEHVTSVVRSLRGALLVIATVLAVLALLAMHSVVAQASPAMASHGVAQSAEASHGSAPQSVEHCPCPGDSDSSMSMAECTPVAALTGVVSVASLRAQWAVAAPLPTPPSRSASAVTGALTPSLHTLSINRT